MGETLEFRCWVLPFESWCQLWVWQLRLPAVIEVNASPKTMEISNLVDDTVNLSAGLKFNPQDANKEFYRNMGLPADKLFEGNEMVLEAGFYYGMKLNACGHDWIHIRRTYIGATYSESFRPPLGNRKTNKMFEIPASLTQTELDPNRMVSLYDTMAGLVRIRVGDDGMFVVNDSSDGNLLKANKVNGRNFSVVNHSKEGENDVVALENGGSYVRAGVNSDSKLALGGNRIGSWQLFIVHKKDGGVVLQSKQSQKFISVGSDLILRADKSRVSQGTVFYIYRQEE